MALKKFDNAVCEDSGNIDKILQQGSVDLSIIVPPHVELDDSNSKTLELIDRVMKKVAKVTKPGGICCLVLSDDISESGEKFLNLSKEILLCVLGKRGEQSDWTQVDEIIWVKSPKEKAESMNKAEEGLMIDFGETPFSQICVLQKKGSEFELKNRHERLEELRLAEQKKIEMQDSVWFVQPASQAGYKDRIDQEVASRLMLLYSDQGGFVLDPFAGDGITGAVAKTLGRHFLCIDKDENKINSAKKRIG